MLAGSAHRTADMTQVCLTIFKAALAALSASAAVSPAAAADLVLRNKVAVVKKVHVFRTLVGRDYDGTPVRMKPYRKISVGGADGIAATRTEYELVPVQATPRYYLNGQPVMPNMYPRNWRRNRVIL